MGARQSESVHRLRRDNGWMMASNQWDVSQQSDHKQKRHQQGMAGSQKSGSCMLETETS